MLSALNTILRKRAIRQYMYPTKRSSLHFAMYVYLRDDSIEREFAWRFMESFLCSVYAIDAHG